MLSKLAAKLWPPAIRARVVSDFELRVVVAIERNYREVVQVYRTADDNAIIDWSSLLADLLHREVLVGGSLSAVERWALRSNDTYSTVVSRVVREALERRPFPQQEQVGGPDRTLDGHSPPTWRLSARSAAERLRLHHEAIAAGRAFDRVEAHTTSTLASAQAYYARQMESHTPSVETMTGQQFEEWCASFLLRSGWKCEITKISGDQGVDIVARKHDRVLAVQCKRYRGSVGNAAVQEVFAGMAHVGATEGLVVSTGKFTRAAVSLAQATGVTLLGHDELGRLGHE